MCNYKTEQINHLIETHKLSVLIINELNLDSTDRISREMFENYKLETDNLDVIDKTSRTGILIHHNIHYKRRRDLEEPGLSTIWIKLSFPGRKPVLVQGLYRQHQRLGQEGTKSITRQQNRWDRILSKWETAAKENIEIITMGDMNVNSLSWDLPDNQKTSQDKAQSKMSDMLRERILSRGFVLLGNQPTRIPDNPQSRPAALDLMITNRLEKIENYQV